jgi:hypothetical protein
MVCFRRAWRLAVPGQEVPLAMPAIYNSERLLRHAHETVDGTGSVTEDRPNPTKEALEGRHPGESSVRAIPMEKKFGRCTRTQTVVAVAIDQETSSSGGSLVSTCSHTIIQRSSFIRKERPGLGKPTRARMAGRYGR